MRRPPPRFANTMLASWVWKGLVCFEASWPGFKQAGGLGGSSPPNCKHNARIMDLEGIRMLSSKLARLKREGGWGVGGGMLASWVWKGFVCFESSLPGLKRRGCLGERSPAPGHSLTGRRRGAFFVCAAGAGVRLFSAAGAGARFFFGLRVRGHRAPGQAARKEMPTAKTHPQQNSTGSPKTLNPQPLILHPKPSALNSRCPRSLGMFPLILIKGLGFRG